VTDVAALLLTGGSSRRMGTDKALLVVSGETLAQRAARLLGEITELAIEVGPGYSNLTATREDPPGAGPLAAVAAGAAALARAGHLGPALVLACDLPLVTRPLLSFLAGRPGSGSVLPVVSGRAQPLCARWSADDLAAAADLVASGERSLRRLPSRERAEVLAEPEWSAVATAEAFADADSPADLEALGLRWRVGDADREHGSAAGDTTLGAVHSVPVAPDWVLVTSDQLPVAEALAWAVLPSCGAVVTFCGTVRDHSDGREGITQLEYECYEEHAAGRLAAVAAAAREQWPALGRVALLHRFGALKLGEVSVVVAVSSPHRPEAFSAARFCIDTLKETVPIWKRETWPGGSDWALCSHELLEVSDATT
jgi:molybdopterin synthase catalytic subunit